MKKLLALASGAVLSVAIAGPATAQEATQEPGVIGFYYPQVDYLTGGWGVRTPSYGYRGIGPYAYYGGPRAYFGGPIIARPPYPAIIARPPYPP